MTLAPHLLAMQPETTPHFPTLPSPHADILEDSASMAHPKPRKDDELWFDDGNLIIVAGDTEFRVYKGPLLLHSEVIRDMVSMPPPSSSDAVGDMAPNGPGMALAWVPVHSVEFHDSPADVKHFLRTFAPGRQLR